MRFAAGPNFYRYVANNPVKKRDPRGLWQVTVGGGLGLGALATFGNNNGQFNFGLYTGLGLGLYGDFDPASTGGCNKFGASGGVEAHGGVGVPYAYASVDATAGGGSEGEVQLTTELPGGAGLAWSPTNPNDSPHGVAGAGEGGFAGLGFHFNSPPTQCGCSGGGGNAGNGSSESSGGW